MPRSETQHRAREFLETFHSPVLQGNPLGVSPEREIKVYLPPGYDEGTTRYPVVYLLHGYGGDSRHAIVENTERMRAEFPSLLRLVFRRLFNRLVTTEKLDKLILGGSLPPFILVQPDGSLHIPHMSGGTHPGGDEKQKGSLYVDSPWTGRFFSSVFGDVIEHVDATYRTIADRRSRAVIGGSMGGYGALLAGVFKPDQFCSVAALSPSVCGLDVVDLRLYVPFLRWVHGEAGARRAGAEDLADILDTCDLVFSGDRRLVPTIKRDANGNAVAMDETARQNWADWDVGHLARVTDGAFDGVALRISCEERDEFGFAGPDARLSRDLHAIGVDHELHLFRNNTVARLSAHSGGIGIQVEAGLRFCLDHMVVSAP